MKDMSNSFSRRPVLTQIIAYFVVTSQLLVFSTCLQNHIISTSSRIVVLILYYTSLLGLVVATCITSCSDPSEGELDPDEGGKEVRLFCQTCRKIVREHTRHCKVCNICVGGFDHHCVWVNNCIGLKNYRAFAAMTTLLLVHFIIFLGGVIVVWTQQDWHLYLPAMITSWVIAPIILIFSFLDLGLIIFHIFLNCKSKTTYEYLTEKARQNPKITPEPELPHRSQNLQNTDSNLKVSQPQIASLQTQQVCRERSQSHKSRISMVFENQSEESSQQLPPFKGRPVKVELESNHEPSERETVNECGTLRRNKSWDYILGRILSDEPQRINYNSAVMPRVNIIRVSVVGKEN